MNIYRRSGFTLIELMVVIAIVAILAALAAPSFRDLIMNNRMSSQSNEFLTTLALARSEAVKRNVTVTVCKSADNATCTTAGTWAQGWIVFTDINTGGGTVGVLNTANGDALIRAYGALPGNTTLTGSASVTNFIAYRASGMTSLGAGTNHTVSLCPPSPAIVAGRDIQISASGRARVQNPPAAACP